MFKTCKETLINMKTAWLAREKEIREKHEAIESAKPIKKRLRKAEWTGIFFGFFYGLVFSFIVAIFGTSWLYSEIQDAIAQGEIEIHFPNYPDHPGNSGISEEEVETYSWNRG